MSSWTAVSPSSYSSPEKRLGAETTLSNNMMHSAVEGETASINKISDESVSNQELAKLEEKVASSKQTIGLKEPERKFNERTIVEELATLQKVVTSAKLSMQTKMKTNNQRLQNISEDLKDLTQTVTALQQSIESTHDTNSQELLAAVKDHKETVALQTKLQALAWAIEYYPKQEFSLFPDSCDREEMKRLVLEILYSFRKELPITLEDSSYAATFIRDDTARNEFKYILIQELWGLTGQKPRIRYCEETDEHIMYFS